MRLPSSPHHLGKLALHFCRQGARWNDVQAESWSWVLERPAPEKPIEQRHLSDRRLPRSRWSAQRERLTRRQLVESAELRWPGEDAPVDEALPQVPLENLCGIFGCSAGQES